MMGRSRMMAGLLLAGLCVAMVAGPLWAQSPEELRQLRDDEIAKITEAMPTKAAVTPEKPRKVLVFWRCEGFFHTVIPVANKALEIMGEKTGAFEVTLVTDDYAVFTEERLKEFDVIVLNNTTHLRFDPENTPERCKALMDFIKGGKGLVGLHAAADNFYKWPEGMEMMGNKFTGHPWNAPGTWAFKIDEPDHPLMAPFKGEGFQLSDEIYRTDPPLYSRDKLFVLMSLDMSDEATRTVNGVREGDEDTGITWIRPWGEGRVFYCSLGHNDAVFMHPQILEHLMLGMQFAAGDLEVPMRSDGSGKEQAMRQHIEKIKAYDFGQSRQALTEFGDEIRKAYGNPEALKKFEAALIEVLQSDAKYAGKQYACRELSIIGTEQSVPVLASMLTNEEYSDMARYALERIPGEAVNRALLAALGEAQGNVRIGIINSLGERCCRESAGQIARMVGDADDQLSSAAICALGKIGGPEALGALNKALQSAPEAQKMLVYDAFLKIADAMVAEGQRLEARKIYVSLNRDGVPSLVRAAAMKGLVGSAQPGGR